MLNKNRDETPEHCKQKRISCKQTLDEKCENTKRSWKKKGRYKKWFLAVDACCYFYINSFSHFYFHHSCLFQTYSHIFSRLFALNIIPSEVAIDVVFFCFFCFFFHLLFCTCSGFQVITRKKGKLLKKKEVKT